ALFIAGSTFFSGGCAYLGHVKAQNEYRKSLEADPKLGTAKHILRQRTFFVYGRIEGDPTASTKERVAVLAFSSDLQADEIVDICNVARSGSYYGMNLPAGSYQIALARDLNDNGLIDADEVEGVAMLELNAAAYPGYVAA